MIIRYFFVLISVFISQLSTILTLQENEKTQYENSLKEFEALMEAIEHDNEPSNLAQNLTEQIIKKKIKIPIEKKKLRQARNILLQLRDYVYNAEAICIRNTSKMTNSTVTPSTLHDTPSINTIFPKSYISTSPTIRRNEGKHCIRWKNFFNKCYHRDFLPIKAKINTSWDRKVFSEQIDVLISITKKFRSVHLEERWYKDPDYSKENLIRSLKEHTTFHDTFLTFISILYDIVSDFYERWRIIV